jgi:hypothetical protein
MQQRDEALVALEEELNKERQTLSASLQDCLRNNDLFRVSLLLRGVDLLSNQTYFSNSVYQTTHQSFVQAQLKAQNFSRQIGCLIVPHAAYAMDYQLLSLQYFLQLSQLVDPLLERPMLMRFLLIGWPVIEMSHLSFAGEEDYGLLAHLSTLERLLDRLQNLDQEKPVRSLAKLRQEVVGVDIDALRLTLEPLIAQAQACLVEMRENGARRYTQRLGRDLFYQQVFQFTYQREPTVAENRLFWWRLLTQTLRFYETLALETKHYLL